MLSSHSEVLLSHTLYTTNMESIVPLILAIMEHHNEPHIYFSIISSSLWLFINKVIFQKIAYNVPHL